MLPFGRSVAGKNKGVAILLTVLVSLLAVGFGLRNPRRLLIFLPGTQVGSVAPADNVLVCRQCHYSTVSTRPVEISSYWSGSMMAQSARDPVFYAALAVANKYNATAGQAFGEYCIRCHSPMGWLAGHSEDYTGQSLTGTDFDGVQCDYCHRAIDPLHPDTTAPTLNYPVPGYGNGMHVVERVTDPKRGPFPDAVAPHATMYSPFQTSSELCGVCHDVSNPFYAQDRISQAPYQYSALERTYSEWLMSWYATQGDSGTCESCHMKDTTGYACSYLSAPARDNLARHDLTGGNTFVPDILPDFWAGLDTSLLAFGKQRALAKLQSAARMTLVSYKSGDSVIAKVNITNLTGHKLPTGYPDGRRMWINLVGTNLSGDTLFQSGVYRPDSALLIRDAHIKVYEAVQGLTSSRASSYGLSAGASFHFILNDTILFDNRIPPRGFTNSAFRSRLAQPVGAVYADGQNSDVTQYTLPSGTEQVTANLYYQTMSKEYVDFLRDENSGNSMDWNSWGSKLHTSWENKGKSQPVVMQALTVPVSDTVVSVDEGRTDIPPAFELQQNYPNPFNPATTVSFVIDRPSLVSLKVFDMTGREVASLVHERKSPGAYAVSFDGSDLASGIYMVRLQADDRTRTRKMLLVR
jgi:hypothetical protein